MSSKLLSNADAARLLGLAPATLRLYRHRGKGPRYVKLGPCQQAVVVYHECDVLQWRDARTFANTSDATVNFPATA